MDSKKQYYAVDTATGEVKYLGTKYPDTTTLFASFDKDEINEANKVAFSQFVPADNTITEWAFDPGEPDPYFSCGNYGSEYSTIRMTSGSTYYVPWKFVPTGSTGGMVNVTLAGDQVMDNYMFVTSFGSVLTPEAGVLTLPPGDDQTDYTLFAIYKGVKNTQVGQLKVRSESPKNYGVTLVPVGNGVTAPSATSIKEGLDAIYKPYAIEWDVKVNPVLKAGSDVIIAAGDEFMSNYSPDQIALHQDFLKTGSVEAGRSVVFLLSTFPTGIDDSPFAKGGDMPIGRKWGYLFGNAVTPRTLAHELGHGRFSLKHTFDYDYCKNATKGSTPNLMDYSTGTGLNRFQWEACHNKALAGGIFQSDEDAAGDLNAEQLMAFIQQKVKSLPDITGKIATITHTKICTGTPTFEINPATLPANLEGQGLAFNASAPGYSIFILFLYNDGGINVTTEQGDDPNAKPNLKEGLVITLKKDGSTINCQNDITQLNGLMPCMGEPVTSEYISLLLDKAQECLNNDEVGDAFSGQFATITGLTSFNMANFETALQGYLDESPFSDVKIAVKLFSSTGENRTLLTPGLTSEADAELTLNYYYNYANNSLKTSIKANDNYLSQFETAVRIRAEGRGITTLDIPAMRNAVIADIPSSINNAVSITEFASATPFNKAKEVLRFMQVAQLNIKSIWETGNLHKGTWSTPEQSNYPVYAKVGPLPVGAVDAGIEEATEQFLFGKMIYEVFANKEMREGMWNTFTTASGLSNLCTNVAEQFSNLSGEDLLHLSSKVTVQTGIFIYTGGLSALAKGGKKALDVVKELGSLAVRDFDGCPKLIKKLDNLKSLGKRGLSQLDNLSKAAKRFTYPKKLEEIYSRIGDNITKFADDITNSTDDVVELFDNDVEKIDSWKLIDDEGIDASFRRNVDPLTDPDAAIDAVQTSQKANPTLEAVRALWKRGNDFNRKARNNQWYDYHEINLANGKRLDSYDPDLGEIVSRKATDFDNIQPSTFENYLKEIDNKYSPGTVIRSNKYPELDGKQLLGKKILEVPASNQTSPKLAEFQRLADKYIVELRFQPE